MDSAATSGQGIPSGPREWVENEKPFRMSHSHFSGSGPLRIDGPCLERYNKYRSHHDGIVAAVFNRQASFKGIGHGG